MLPNLIMMLCLFVSGCFLVAELVQVKVAWSVPVGWVRCHGRRHALSWLHHVASVSKTFIGYLRIIWFPKYELRPRNRGLLSLDHLSSVHFRSLVGGLTYQWKGRIAVDQCIHAEFFFWRPSLGVPWGPHGHCVKMFFHSWFNHDRNMGAVLRISTIGCVTICPNIYPKPHCKAGK